MADTRRAAAVHPEGLDESALTAHISHCLGLVEDGGARHHRFNPTPGVPLGAFFDSVGEWTGLGPTRLMALLEGASPVSAGRSPERAALVTALRGSKDARRILDSAPEQDVSARLCEA